MTRGIVFLDTAQNLIRVVDILKSNGEPIKWSFCNNVLTRPDLSECEQSSVISDACVDVVPLGGIVVNHS